MIFTQVDVHGNGLSAGLRAEDLDPGKVWGWKPMSDLVTDWAGFRTENLLKPSRLPFSTANRHHPAKRFHVLGRGVPRRALHIEDQGHQRHRNLSDGPRMVKTLEP